MKKIRYIVIITIFLVISLLFFRKFLLYQPILDHFEKRFERKWGCQATMRKADVNLLKGSLTFKDVHMMTPENVVSRWNLHADEIFIQIDYRSLMSETIIINELIVDKVVFRQEKKKSPDSKKKDILPKVIRKEGKNKYVQKKKSRSRDPRKAVLIRYLLIRDGYFEFYYHKNSGEKGRLQMESINLSRKEIFLDRKLDVFFRSLFESLNIIGP